VSAASDNVVYIDRVRCLECGMKYVKPADGGSARQNPGCPRCGYLGWITATIPPARRPFRRAGLQQ
jgi:transposase-like protein